MTYEIEGCVCCGRPLGIEQGVKIDACGCSPSCETCVDHHSCGSICHEVPGTPGTPGTKSHASLEDLKGVIQAANPNDQALFHKIMAVGWHLGAWKEKDLFLLFGASVPTAQRWILGKSAPHPLMRQHFYEDLIRLIDNKR